MSLENIRKKWLEAMRDREDAIRRVNYYSEKLRIARLWERWKVGK